LLPELCTFDADIEYSMLTGPKRLSKQKVMITLVVESLGLLGEYGRWQFPRSDLCCSPEVE